jgi:bacterioferritin-associated ferredoxin
MIICSCNVLSDRDVRSALLDAAAPVHTPGQVYSCLGCSPQCGRCARSIRRIMSDALACCAAGCACGDAGGG